MNEGKRGAIYGYPNPFVQLFGYVKAYFHLPYRQTIRIDLDTLPSGTPDWAHGAIKEGKTVINMTDLAEFLNIFEATLGFFRLTIYWSKALLPCIYRKRIRAQGYQIPKEVS
jgi:hypothetical protein